MFDFGVGVGLRFEVILGKWGPRGESGKGEEGRRGPTQCKPDYSPYTFVESTDIIAESQQLGRKDLRCRVFLPRGSSNRLGLGSKRRSLVLRRFYRNAKMRPVYC